MEYHGTRLSSRGRRTEPSWPKVIATTVRLWAERHPVFGRKAPRRRRVMAWLAVLAVVALGAGVTGAVLGQATSSPASPQAAGQSGARPPGPAAAALGASAVTRATAARWIAGQVASSAVIACDPAMCTALQADGIAATRLLVLGTAAADPLGSDLVVATAAVRNQFGARLATVYAPAVVASFGSGTGQIDVRAVAPDGAAAYQATAAAERSGRIAAGKQLLENPRLTVAAGAQAALRSGQVDARLLILLAALAGQQPVRVSSFGDPAPGAASGVPLRSAVIASPAAGAAGASRLRSALAFIEAQRPPYLPLQASLDGTSALTVEYAAPSPLGLLSGP